MTVGTDQGFRYDSHIDHLISEVNTPPQDQPDMAEKKNAGADTLPSQYWDKLKFFEGYKSKPYWDNKQWSVGYGTRASGPNDVIDEPEAHKRLQGEVGKAVDAVDKFNPYLDPGTRAALTDLTYNTGVKWMKAGLGQAITRGDLEDAKRRYVQYNKASGEVSKGLTWRRNQAVGWIGNKDFAPQKPDQNTPQSSKEIKVADNGLGTNSYHSEVLRDSHVPLAASAQLNEHGYPTGNIFVDHRSAAKPEYEDILANMHEYPEAWMMKYMTDKGMDSAKAYDIAHDAVTKAETGLTSHLGIKDEYDEHWRRVASQAKEPSDAQRAPDAHTTLHDLDTKMLGQSFDPVGETLAKKGLSTDTMKQTQQGSEAVSSALNPFPDIGKMTEQEQRNFFTESLLGNAWGPEGKAIFGGIAAGSSVGRKMLLRTAENAERMGHTAEQIFAHTGWFRGLDTEWNFEVQDWGAKLTIPPKPSANVAYQLGDVLQHDNMFKEFPYLRNVKIEHDPTLGNDGWADLGKDVIHLNMNSPNFRENMFHEIQHFVQYNEHKAAHGGRYVEDSPRWSTGSNIDEEREKLGRQPGKVFPAKKEYEAIRNYKQNLGEVAARTVGRRAVFKGQHANPEMDLLYEESKAHADYPQGDPQNSPVVQKYLEALSKNIQESLDKKAKNIPIGGKSSEDPVERMKKWAEGMSSKEHWDKSSKWDEVKWGSTYRDLEESTLGDYNLYRGVPVDSRSWFSKAISGRTNLQNKAMQREIKEGRASDISHFPKDKESGMYDITSGVHDPDKVMGLDFANAKTEEWVQAIYQRESDGKILATTDPSAFFKRKQGQAILDQSNWDIPGHRLLWLR